MNLGVVALFIVVKKCDWPTEIWIWEIWIDCSTTQVLFFTYIFALHNLHTQMWQWSKVAIELGEKSINISNCMDTVWNAMYIMQWNV